MCGLSHCRQTQPWTTIHTSHPDIGSQRAKVSELCCWGYWCSSGFGHRLQLMRCAYLLTLSEYFGVGRTFGVLVKSDTSLHSGGGNEARRGSAYRWLKSCGRGNKLLK